MHHEEMRHEETELGKVLPGIDLTLWVQLVIVAIVAVAATAWALAAF